MLAFSPQLFATVVTGALRLGREGYNAYLHGLMDDQDIRAFVPLTSSVDLDDPVSKASPEIESWVIQQVMFSEEFFPGAPYEGIFLCHPGAPTSPVIGLGGVPKLNPEKPEIFEAALLEKILEHQRREKTVTSARQIRQSLITFHTKAWSDEDDPSPWGLFFRHTLDVGFDILAVQPGLVGFGTNAESFISALMPNLAAAYNAEDTGQHNVLREIAETFSEAALKSLADNPNLVTDEARWQPLISGILKPVHEDVTKNGVNQLFAERRLRELMSGPVAFGALSALSEHPDDFLKGEFDGQSVPGMIIRDTLGVIASGSAEGFKTRRFFSDQAAMTVMGSALKIARDRPQLFMRKSSATGDPPGHGAKLLAAFAETFLTAPLPFRADKALAVELTCKSLDVMSEYAQARLARHAGSDSHREMRADMAAHLVADLLSGFQRRLTGEKESLLSDVFSKAQIVDVMQIMARHVAKSPHHFISEDRNPQVVAMAEAVAQAIAEDETGLLTGADWHSIIAVAMDVALKNPGRLFSLESNNPEDAVALVLISRLLKTSRDGIKSLPPGTTWLMFGETLSKAIRITLTAAASGALSLIKDPTKREAHLNEVSVLAGRLNKLAGSDDPEKAISADDWLAIYAFYIAHVLEKGPGTLNKLSDAELLSALTDGTITLTEDTHA